MSLLVNNTELRPAYMGLWLTWSSGRCPCPWQGGGNLKVFKVPSNPFYISKRSWSQAGALIWSYPCCFPYPWDALAPDSEQCSCTEANPAVLLAPGPETCSLACFMYQYGCSPGLHPSFLSFDLHEMFIICIWKTESE